MAHIQDLIFLANRPWSPHSHNFFYSSAISIMEYQPTRTMAHILCCQCGVSIEPNSANMCMPCLQAKVDITEGIPRQIALQTCRGCDRYFQPPAQWLTCEPESKE